MTCQRASVCAFHRNVTTSVPPEQAPRLRGAWSESARSLECPKSPGRLQPAHTRGGPDSLLPPGPPPAFPPTPSPSFRRVQASERRSRCTHTHIHCHTASPAPSRTWSAPPPPPPPGGASPRSSRSNAEARPGATPLRPAGAARRVPKPSPGRQLLRPGRPAGRPARPGKLAAGTAPGGTADPSWTLPHSLVAGRRRRGARAAAVLTGRNGLARLSGAGCRKPVKYRPGGETRERDAGGRARGRSPGAEACLGGTHPQAMPTNTYADKPMRKCAGTLMHLFPPPPLPPRVPRRP